MRKILATGAAALTALGLSAASAATVPVTFMGSFGAVANGTTAPGATDPGVAGAMFQIVLDYDDVADQLTGAMIMIDADGDGDFDDASDMFERYTATVVDAPSGSSPNAIDSLSIDLNSFDGAAAGAHSLRFEFFNTVLNSESLGDALTALGSADDMGMLICSHIMFNFGGFKYEGILADGGIVIGNADPIPLPGAAVFMISGLAAAGAVSRRRKAAA